MQPVFGFVSTGEKTAMYTFRVMYDIHVVIDGQNRIIRKSFHHQNLSIDRDRANRMAAAFCDDMGIPLNGTAEFELQEIKRRSAEELASLAERIAREVAEQKQRYVEQQREFYNTSIRQGVFVTGKHTGISPKDVAQIDPDYIFWLAAQEVVVEVPNKLTVNIELAKRFIEETGMEKPGFLGEIGMSLEAHVTLVNKTQTNGQFPSLLCVARSETGETIKWFSNAKGFRQMRVGQRFKVGGVVKSHDTWKDRLSTMLSKPKVLELDLFQVIEDIA